VRAGAPLRAPLPARQLRRSDPPVGAVFKLQAPLPGPASSMTVPCVAASRRVGMARRIPPRAPTAAALLTPARDAGVVARRLPPPPRTNRTRRVPHPVLIGHAASLGRGGGAAPGRYAPPDAEPGRRTARGRGRGARDGAWALPGARWGQGQSEPRLDLRTKTVLQDSGSSVAARAPACALTPPRPPRAQGPQNETLPHVFVFDASSGGVRPLPFPLPVPLLYNLFPPVVWHGCMAARPER